MPDKEHVILSSRGLCKTIQGAAILHDIDITVHARSVYALLGPNGAGKSTLIKTLVGVLKASSGSVVFADGAASKMGVLIETPSLYDNLSAYDNLRVFCLLRKVPTTRIAQVLDLVSLGGTGAKRVAHFSLGMKQRLAIAAALLHEPALLILDEPTNGLDPEGIASLRLFIKSLPERFGTTVVVSSHMLHEVEQMADEVGIMKDGSLVYQGTLERLKHEYPRSHNLEDVFMMITAAHKESNHE